MCYRRPAPPVEPVQRARTIRAVTRTGATVSTVHEHQTPLRTIPTDASLVGRLKAGDAEAFEYMVRTTGGRLLSVARRMLHDEEAARDTVQDAFLSAFRSLDGFDGQAQLSTW